MRKKGVITLSWENIYLFCLFIWSLFYSLSNDTTIGSSLGESIYRINFIVWFVIQIILAFKIIFQRPILKRKLALGFGIIALAMISYYYSASTFLVAFFWFMASAYKTDSKRIVKVLFVAQLILLILTLSMSIFGIIDNYSVTRETTGILRQSFGFLHPNTLAQKVFQLEMMYLYLQFKKLSVKHLFFVGVVGYVVKYIADSQTAWYATIASIAFFTVYLISENRIKLLSALSRSVIKSLKYIFIAIATFSIYAAIFYTNISFITGIGTESSLYSRFSQMYLYLQSYSVNLLGQPLYYHKLTSTVSSAHSELYTLDNSYIYLLLGFGVVTFAIFIILYSTTIYRSVKNRTYVIVILLVIYAIFGFTETTLIRFSYNFVLIFLFETVWKTNIPYRKRIIRDSNIEIEIPMSDLVKQN